MDVLDIVKKVISGSNYYNTAPYLNATDLSELPIIDKIEVQKNWDKIYTAPQKVIYSETSGSTGTPLKIAWNPSEYVQSIMTLWRLRRTHGIYSTDFFLTCHAGFYINSDRIQDEIVVTGNSLSLSKLCYKKDTMQQYTHYIKLFSPKWIYGQPSFVYYLGCYLSEYAPDIALTFTYIELVGELLSPEIKKSISEYFPNAHIINMYGMQEFNGILYEKNGHMVPIEENAYIEVVNENGEQCEINQEGDIVVTGLINSAFPLIRYKTGDRGKRIIYDSNISYLITAGRSNDELVYDGRRYDGSIFFIIINEYNRTHKSRISRFQVTYEHMMLFFKIFSFDDLPPKKEIEHDLKRILYSIDSLQIDLEVQIQTAEYFSTSSNKIKYFISE